MNVEVSVYHPKYDSWCLTQTIELKSAESSKELFLWLLQLIQEKDSMHYLIEEIQRNVKAFLNGEVKL